MKLLKITTTLFILGLILTMTACKSIQTKKDSFNPLLLNCWTHSYEEDKDGLKTFRPCEYKKFPPARYRNVFTLEADGKTTYLVLAPTDRHYKEDGKWTYDAKTSSLIIYNLEGEEKAHSEIIELTKDKLILKDK